MKTNLLKIKKEIKFITKYNVNKKIKKETTKFTLYT